MDLYNTCRIEDVPIFKDGEIVGYKMRNTSVAARCLELRGRRLGAFTDKKVIKPQYDYVDILCAANGVTRDGREIE